MKDLRARLLAQRRALDRAAVSALSSQVIDRFTQGCRIPQAAWKGLRVALYRSLADELDLRELERRLVSWGARLCFPRVVDLKAGVMELADLASAPATAVWSRGAYGIEEPPAGLSTVDPSVIDVVFVPGVAFGLQGERLGMGAGFYDRWLPRAPRALRVALAFDFQLLPKIDQEPWDQPMHWIWTDRRQVQLRAWTPG